MQPSEMTNENYELKVALQYAYRDYCTWHSGMGTRPESLQRFGMTTL